MVRKLKNYVVKKYRENEWLQRATRTFAQAAVGTITTGLCSGKFGRSSYSCRDFCCHEYGKGR